MNIMELIKDLGQLLLLSGGFLLFSAKQQLELENRKSGCQVGVRNQNDVFQVNCVGFGIPRTHSAPSQIKTNRMIP